MHGTSVQRTNGDVVKQAEPHAAPRFGVVPRRTDGAERIVGIAPSHRVDRGDNRTGGMQCCVARPRRQYRVSIKLGEPVFGNIVEYEIDITAVVDAFQLIAGG